MKTKSRNQLQYESNEEMLMHFKVDKHPFLTGFLRLFGLNKSTNILRGLLAWALLSCLLVIVSIFIF